MAKVKTLSLNGTLLNLAVARLLYQKVTVDYIGGFHGHPVEARVHVGEGDERHIFDPVMYDTQYNSIEEQLDVILEYQPCYFGLKDVWRADCYGNDENANRSTVVHPDKKVAAIRCFIISRCGNEVNIPDEVIQMIKDVAKYDTSM